MRAFDLSIPIGHYVESEAEAVKWIDRFLITHKANDGLGLDSETTGLRIHKDIVLVWSLSDGVDRICLDSRMIPLFREPILENPEINFDLTRAKFDAHMFANTGVDITKAGRWRDTTVQSWLLNENNQGRHGLKECIKDHFHRETPTFESVFGKIPHKRKGQVQLTSGELIRRAFADPEKREQAADYASLDAYNSTTLRKYFDDLLKQQVMYDGMSLYEFFHMVEVPFTKVLYNCERRGIIIDKGMLDEMQPSMKASLDKIEKAFAQAAGRIINLRSPPQMQYFFFELLKKTPTKYTDGGASGNKSPSTDAEVLEEWAGDGDVYALQAISHRGIAKIHDTYVVSLPEWLDTHFRIHTSLNQTGTVTGRLSSSEPNLQNIPRPGEDKFKIRDAFLPGDGMILMVADYAQLEMRLMAHFSGDEKMIDAILKGVDLHCLTVAEVYGFPYDDVMAAVKAEKAFKKGKGPALTEHQEMLILMRQAAKATGFGIIYGIGGAHLAANLTRDLSTPEKPAYYSPEQGVDLVKKWKRVFPGVDRFIESTKQWIWAYGYVQTILGRFRRFGDLRGMKKQDASQCERQGVNSIIQGTASDIAKMAMICADNDPELAAVRARLLLQIHDELIWELPDNDEAKNRAKARATQIMEHPFVSELKVPLPVEIGFGYSWATAK